MKKIALIAFLLFCVSFLKAQGNLQFNQIIFYDIAPNATQAITVPAGKVWKIESVSSGGSNSTPLYLRNSGGAYIAHFNTTSYSSSSFPFWLPTGFAGTLVNLHPSTRYTMSIIEFNVVP
ncbi:MAG TPA: hypothetical protein VK826_10740 [Bacteroidia bacterium]|nr:hypothetical protein [Bacteroidia bacterium]